MVSLVAQKFLSDVAYEALQHCKMRGGGKEMKKVTLPILALIGATCLYTDPFSKENVKLAPHSPAPTHVGWV